MSGDCFAVIDTETNWANEVMSIGVVLAERGSFRLLESRYIIDPRAAAVGGMFEAQLYLKSHVSAERGAAAQEIGRWLHGAGVSRIFAYNAGFDKKLLPELGEFQWQDILRLAAYRQHNPTIPPGAECCKTGRLKRGYGVEPILRGLSKNPRYRETHNALQDAMDELKIMELLGHDLALYPDA